MSEVDCLFDSIIETATQLLSALQQANVCPEDLVGSKIKEIATLLNQASQECQRLQQDSLKRFSIIQDETGKFLDNNGLFETSEMHSAKKFLNQAQARSSVQTLNEVDNGKTYRLLSINELL